MWYIQLFYFSRILQLVTVQCLENFIIFVMEGAGKKRKKVVLTIKTKLGIYIKLENDENHKQINERLCYRILDRPRRTKTGR